MSKHNKPKPPEHVASQADSGSPQPSPVDGQREYEFNSSQNEVINQLANAMMWVRIPLMVSGLMQGMIAAGLAFRIPQDGAHIIGALGYGLGAVLSFVLASWLFKAASSFTRVTTTSGQDISYLMGGLKNLGSWFDLLAFFVKLYLALLAVLLVLMLIGLVTGAFRGPEALPTAV